MDFQYPITPHHFLSENTFINILLKPTEENRNLTSLNVLKANTPQGCDGKTVLRIVMSGGDQKPHKKRVN